MTWHPRNEEKALKLSEFLAMAEKKYPGISRNPLLRKALKGPGQTVEDALVALDPVRARANARIKGYSKPFTAAEHIATFKHDANVRTYRKRTNTKRRHTRRTRRNYGPGNNREQLDALFALLGGLYISNDKPVLALREMIQNSADAINDPKYGSKALGQIGPDAGRIDVVFDRHARTLSVSDNGSGMTPEIICKFTTLGGTTKGKPVSRMSKAEIQRLYPPFQLTVRAFAREGTIQSPPDGGRYWVRINGIFQFDEGKRQQDYLLPSDYLLDFKSPRTAGGFGAAKAVIFMTSTSIPFKWDLHTQDNFYTGEMADEDTDKGSCRNTSKAAVEKVAYRQGTKLTIYDLDAGLFDGVGTSITPEGNRLSGSGAPIEARMKRVLAANNLKGITIIFNGEEVPPMFRTRGGSIVNFGSETQRNWFDGIFLHPKDLPNPRENIKKALQGKSSNPQGDYPFSKGRDTFLGQSRKGFASFQYAVEINPMELNKKRNEEEDIVFDPQLSLKSAANLEVDTALEKGFETKDIDRFLDTAAQASADFGESLAKEDKSTAALEAARAEKVRKIKEEAKRKGEYSNVDRVEEKIEKGSKNTAAVAETIVKVAEQAEKVRKVTNTERKQIAYYKLVDQLIDMLDTIDTIRRKAGLDTLEYVASRVKRSYSTTEFNKGLISFPFGTSQGDLVKVLIVQQILNRAAIDGGSGLLEINAFNDLLDRVFGLYPIDARMLKAAKQQVGVTNPFGNSTALYVSRNNFNRLKKTKLRNWKGKLIKDESGRAITSLEPTFDEARYRRFSKRAGRYVPLLVIWDQIVRTVINTANVKPYNHGPIYTGFLLDDRAYAMWVRTGRGSNLVLINPLATEAVTKSFRTAGDLAAFIHAKACHEIAHMVDGSRHNSGDGHDEGFSILREAIANKTLTLLPLFAEYVSDWSKLRNPYGKEPVAKMKARYKKIADDVTCPSCLKQAVIALETHGRLDTVRWIREQMDWNEVNDET